LHAGGGRCGIRDRHVEGRGPIVQTLVGLILASLLSGCVHLQYLGLFPTGGTVEDSPTGRTIVAGVMVKHDDPAQGKPPLVTLTPDSAPDVIVTITLEAFDSRLRLSEQILALSTRTGDAFVMEPPRAAPLGSPLEGKLYPNGIYRAMYGPLPHGSDVNDWVFVLANEDCSISPLTRAPFDRVGNAGPPQATRRGWREGPASRCVLECFRVPTASSSP
jgi:hypothetical protein